MISSEQAGCQGAPGIQIMEAAIFRGSALWSGGVPLCVASRRNRSQTLRRPRGQERGGRLFYVSENRWSVQRRPRERPDQEPVGRGEGCCNGQSAADQQTNP